MRLEYWRDLSPEQQQSFPPLCPDLVVEPASPSSQGPRCLGVLRGKLTTYQANGVQAFGRGRSAEAFHAAVSALSPAGGGTGSALPMAVHLAAGSLLV